MQIFGGVVAFQMDVGDVFSSTINYQFTQPFLSCMGVFLPKSKSLHTVIIIIDAGGRDSVALRSALVVTQKVYVPIQPSQFDIWTLNQMDELVETAKAFNPDLQARVIISRSSNHPSVHESDDSGKLLDNFPILVWQMSPFATELPTGKRQKTVCQDR